MTNGDSNGNGNGNGNGNKVNRVAVIGANTLIPVGAAVAVFIAAWQVQLFLSKQFQVMQTQLDSLDKKYTEFNYSISGQLAAMRAAVGDRWTTQDMKIWEQELKIRNPSLSVPDSVAISNAHKRDNK